MRHEPSGVHRVTRKAAAELVVNAAGSHAFARVQDHARRLVVVKTFCAAQQQCRHGRLWKFRRAAKAAVARIMGGFEHRRRVAQRVRRQDQIARCCVCSRRFEPRVDFAGGSGNFTAAFPPERGNLLEHLQKAGTAMTTVRRKIRATQKRLQFRREKNVHRPAATAGRGLDKRHVNFVHVRPFLAVHLDADKMFVEKRADLFVLE